MAADQFAQCDERAADQVAAAAEDLEKASQDARKSREAAKKETLMQMSLPGAWQFKDDEHGPWQTSPYDLKEFARRNHLPVQECRARLLKHDAATVPPFRGNAGPFFFRANPDGVPAQGEQAAAPRPAAAPTEDEDFDAMYDSTSDDDEFEVTQILDVDERFESYLVLWDTGETSWVDSTDLQCDELLSQFMASREQSQYERDVAARRAQNAEAIARLGIHNIAVTAAQPSHEPSTQPSPADSAEELYPLGTQIPLTSSVAHSIVPPTPMHPTQLLFSPPPGNTTQRGLQKATSPSLAQVSIMSGKILKRASKPSPAKGSPPPVQGVRQSPRFTKLPDATIPMFDVGARVGAIWRYSEGGTTRFFGRIIGAHDDNTYTIEYDDGDVESHVPATVITPSKKKILDSSPDM